MNFRVQESSLFGGKFISFNYAVGFLHYLLWLILFKTNTGSKLLFIFVCALPLILNNNLSNITIYLLQTSIVIHVLCIISEWRKAVK